jgi:hypothetical protein
MSEKLTLVFSGAAFAMSAIVLALIGIGTRFLLIGLRRAEKQQLEPRVTKGELVFDYGEPELAVKFPGGVMRYIHSDGTMRELGVSNETPIPDNVIPLFGGE